MMVNIKLSNNNGCKFLILFIFIIEQYLIKMANDKFYGYSPTPKKGSIGALMETIID